MTKKISLVAGLMMMSASLLAQIDAVRFQNIVTNMNSGGAGYGAGFRGRYNAAGEIKGNAYLDSAFREINMYLYKSEATIQSLTRYNIYANEFEIQTTAGLRALTGIAVKMFYVAGNSDSTKFVNAKDYKEEGVAGDGFMAVLAEGELSLMRVTKIEIVKPSYNPSLEVGDRDAHILQKTSYYISKNNELTRVKNSKGLLALLGSNKDAVAKFMKDKRLDAKEEEDLIAIINYYNTLARG